MLDIDFKVGLSFIVSIPGRNSGICTPAESLQELFAGV